MIIIKEGFKGKRVFCSKGVWDLTDKLSQDKLKFLMAIGYEGVAKVDDIPVPPTKKKGS